MIEIMAGAINAVLIIGLIVLELRNEFKIGELRTQSADLEKKIQKLTKDTKKYHEELMDSFDDNSITIKEDFSRKRLYRWYLCC